MDAARKKTYNNVKERVRKLHYGLQTTTEEKQQQEEEEICDAEGGRV